MNLGEIIWQVLGRVWEILQWIYFLEYEKLMKEYYGVSMVDLVALYIVAWGIKESTKMFVRFASSALSQVFGGLFRALLNLVINLSLMVVRFVSLRIFRTLEYLFTGPKVATWRQGWRIRTIRFKALFQRPEQ